MDQMAWFKPRPRHGRGFFKQPTVAERKARAQAYLRRHDKGAGAGLDPILIEGALAATWWGKAWNGNLEGYADYANRMARGRSYVRNGSVLDLRIAPGEVLALVQGSRPQPYKVRIDIETLHAPARKRLAEACAGKLESAEALLDGRFPEDLKEILVSGKYGLFPAPAQIRFSCSCPDWASMCKHVAATLYGVGARLDRDPSIFFILRGMQAEDLVSQVVGRNVEALLESRSVHEAEILDLEDEKLGDLFGLDLTKPANDKNPAKRPRSKPGQAETAFASTKAKAPRQNARSNSAPPEIQVTSLMRQLHAMAKQLDTVERALRSALERKVKSSKRKKTGSKATPKSR
jgi:uncharacterized Zn finger protein